MSIMLKNIFIPELIGTALLILFGVGVVANVLLEKSRGKNFKDTFLTISFGWGIGVYIGVYAAYKSGGYLNPAVVLSKIVSGAKFFVNPSASVPEGISVNAANTCFYMIAELLGAMLGAFLAYLVYKKHYDNEQDSDAILSTFVTSSMFPGKLAACVTEAIATFALCYWVLVSGGTTTSVGPLAVALVIVGIGACLGGPTGYAINPARDLGPRIIHAILPIPYKSSSKWDYSWVPIVGPFIGAIIAGILAHIVGVPGTSEILPLGILGQ
jgi:glycerol uptake facilitator protein